jgi:SAM-dependent methyltransferase
MISPNVYLMENDEEEKRLDIKTDPEAVKKQALWCGIGPGARVLDAGCGSGKTTSVINSLIQPGGEVIGVDIAESRIQYARSSYGDKFGINFQVRDIRLPMKDLGQFDFIWVRFVLEYFRNGAIDIIKNLSANLKPDGWMCLLDLDYNCMSYWEMPPVMENIVIKSMLRAQDNYNFDLYAGRKFYAHLYDLGFEDISLDIMAHHLIYGELQASDEFNWMKKMKVGAEKARDLFEAYPGGSERFLSDFKTFFKDPRRFTYTPLMLCKGKNPLHNQIK